MRQEHWAYSLGTYINSIHQTKFKHGEHDCGILAAGCIKALTGIDAMPDMKYTSAAQAARECKRICGSPYVDDLIAHLAKQHGWQEVAATFAHRGDLVVIGTKKDSRLAIVSLHGTHLMTPGDNGLLYEPFDRFAANIKTYHIKFTQSAGLIAPRKVDRPQPVIQPIERPRVGTITPVTPAHYRNPLTDESVAADIDAYKRENKKTVTNLEEALADLRRRGLE